MHKTKILEILEERCGRQSTIVTSQIPWTNGMRSLAITFMPTRFWIASSTNAYRINLTGHSPRRERSNKAAKV